MSTGFKMLGVVLAWTIAAGAAHGAGLLRIKALAGAPKARQAQMANFMPSTLGLFGRHGKRRPPPYIGLGRRRCANTLHLARRP